MADIDVVIVGAGVVGLAIAREFARHGLSVIILESSDAIGTQTSSRNSEVIHAGLYYPTGSLKAQLCVEGRRLLYEYAAQHHIPHKRCGKLIVATKAEEVAQLERLLLQAHANGCTEIHLISGHEAEQRESELRCEAALYSPETGIFDSHAYMLALRGDAEDAGASFAFMAPFITAERSHGEFLITVGGVEPAKISCRLLVNAAGLHASSVASRIDGIHAVHVPPMRYAKGNYFSVRGRNPFSHLIYPAPQIHGLGVHLTFDLAQRAKVGPDIEWVEEPNYSIAQERSIQFYSEVRRYWPGLPDGALSPAYAGIRPKITGPDEAAADFRIDGAVIHGIPGLTNLFGIESPGLTASLAIARKVFALSEYE